MLIGAAINTIKGFADRALTQKKIKDLELYDSSEILDLISQDNRLNARISLAQTEHLYRALKGADRSELSKIEKEIAMLMEGNIKVKRDELALKKATQLDIANLLVTIQKFSTEAADEIDAQNKGLSKLKDDVARKADNVLKQQDDKIQGSIKELSSVIEAQISGFSKFREEISRKTNEEFAQQNAKMQGFNKELFFAIDEQNKGLFKFKDELARKTADELEKNKNEIIQIIYTQSQKISKIIQADRERSDRQTKWIFFAIALTIICCIVAILIARGLI